MITFRSSSKFDKQATVLAITKEQWEKSKFNFKNQKLVNEFKLINNLKQFSAAKCDVFPVIVENKLFILVGLGESISLSLTSFRSVIRKALLSPYLKQVKSLELICDEVSDAKIIAAIEAVLIGTYSWDKYKSSNSRFNKQVFIIAEAKKSFYDTITICEGVNFTRNLVNENADIATSIYLEAQIKKIVKGKKNIKTEILNRREMQKKGLNLHLAVNQASRNEPKLIIVRYQGGAKYEKFTALVGKGITFDTGGLNLKPSGGIESMRLDMAGAGAVIGVLKNTIDLKLKRNIIFAVALAENAISAAAFKPGDVLKSYSGTTVEIGNTDAEGRLVLADAISYVKKNYSPNKIIDIATLTGACVVALAYDHSGLVSTDEELTKALLRSAKLSDDWAWQLPSYPELKDAVQSTIADIKNMGWPKGAGGTITGAEFIRQFAQGTSWAHLDIAGTSFVENSGRLYFGQGATGAGVRLLTHYLQNYGAR